MSITSTAPRPTTPAISATRCHVHALTAVRSVQKFIPLRPLRSIDEAGRLLRGERSQGFFQTLLLGAVLSPVAATEGLLGAVVDLQRPLGAGAHGRGRGTGRPGRSRGRG